MVCHNMSMYIYIYIYILIFIYIHIYIYIYDHNGDTSVLITRQFMVWGLVPHEYRPLAGT